MTLYLMSLYFFFSFNFIHNKKVHSFHSARKIFSCFHYLKGVLILSPFFMFEELLLLNLYYFCTFLCLMLKVCKIVVKFIFFFYSFFFYFIIVFFTFLLNYWFIYCGLWSECKIGGKKYIFLNFYDNFMSA